MKKINLIGHVFGKLTVIEESDKPYKYHRKWVCKCTCGNITHVDGASLRRGMSNSCGCNRHEITHSTTHGYSSSKVFKIWSSMFSRCTNKNVVNYPLYGGRGITICDSWYKFENFLKDMGLPNDSDSIDRIDNDKGYFSENCRWASAKIQANNKSTSLNLTYCGITMTAASWIEFSKIPAGTFYYKYRKGIPIGVIMKFE